jgi:hypothetical protein
MIASQIYSRSLMLDVLKCIYQELPRLAPVFTATCAIVALFIARRQIKTVRQNEAKRQYSQFLFNSVDSKIDPKIVSGNLDIEDTELKDKYRLYLTALMLACEEILAQFGGEPDYNIWRNAVKNKLIPHRNNFVVIDRKSMDDALVEIVEEIEMDTLQQVKHGEAKIAT